MKFSSKIKILILLFFNINSFSITVAQNPIVRRVDTPILPNIRNKNNDKILLNSLNITNRDSLQQSISPYNIERASWLRIIYRKIDIEKGYNAALFYPEYPSDNNCNLISLIFRKLSLNQLQAYEYLDSREYFTNKYIVKFVDILNKFNIDYRENTNNHILNIDDDNIPSNEVRSYYIKEAYFFDENISSIARQVLAICPIITQLSDYGENITIPMFWIKYSDIKPFLSNKYIFLSSLNNISNYTLEDFFELNLYSGEIVKFQNPQNKYIIQLVSSSDSIALLQHSIETELKDFENKIINNDFIKSDTDHVVYKSFNGKIQTTNNRDKRIDSNIDKPKISHQNTVSISSRSVRRN